MPVLSPRRRPLRDVVVTPATQQPVAVVLVDTGLPHLDRPFEYVVPDELDDVTRPGVAVRVRFAGKDVAGWVVERRDAPEHAGALAPIRRVVSPEQVLSADLLRMADAVAEHYAGTTTDVLRLAVPPRHARAEARSPRPVGELPPMTPARAWTAYPAGQAFLTRLTAGESPSAVWQALPAQEPDMDWAAALAEAAHATLAGGRGVVLVVPDARDVERVEAALVTRLGTGHHVRLTADRGPEARYAAWLAVRRGQVHCVIGTRAAQWAPVQRLGLAVCWDDGDDLHDEPRAPYPTVREVLRLRARQHGAAMLVGGFSRSVAAQHWVEAHGWPELLPDQPTLRRVVPRVSVATEGPGADRDPVAAAVRIPTAAYQAAGRALADGPVLVQVPRRGYLPSLRCGQCRAPARCRRCSGPLHLPGEGEQPVCRWCAAAGPFSCATCGSSSVRAGVVGARRTADELGRAFPATKLVTSGAAEVHATVPHEPALVVSTPGAEPRADGGYAAVLLLDGWALLDREGLDAPMEALRRWMAAAALARPGAPVWLAGVPGHAGIPSVEALVRWDPAWLATRELADRQSLHLPPVSRAVRLTSAPRVLREVLEQADLPSTVDVLGPVPVPSDPRRLLSDAPAVPAASVVLRVAPHDLAAVVAALRQVRSVRSARKEPDALSIRFDPRDLGG